MPLLEWTDFSGGMVTDINNINAPKGTMKNLENVDVWSEIGVIQPLNNLSIVDDFPASKVYDHHVMFPAHGDQDYAIIMMDDGSIYSWDGVSFVSIGSVTAGSKMAYGGGFVYVFYRHTTGPTLANTVRKLIKYDYSGSSFSIVDAFVEEKLTIDDFARKGTAAVTNESTRAKVRVVSMIEDGGESYGKTITAFNAGADDFVLEMTRDSDFVKGRIYLSVLVGEGGSAPGSNFLTPQFLFEIEGGSDKTFMTFMTGQYFDDSGIPGFRVYTKISGANHTSALTEILNDHVSSGIDYVDNGHEIIFDGEKYDIVSITHNTSDPNNQYYEVETDRALPAYFNSELGDDGDFTPFDMEIAWVSDVIKVPIQKRHRIILGIQIDENRPESKLTSGTGDGLAFAKSFLFTINPYFPDVFGLNGEDDKKGWLSWSFIKGDGSRSPSLIPNTNLIAVNYTAAEIINISSVKNEILLFHKNGMERIRISDNIPVPIDSSEHGIDNKYNFFNNGSVFFMYSNGKIGRLNFSRKFYLDGNLDFDEISRGVASLVDPSGTPDVRFGWDSEKELLYMHDDDGDWSDNLICSFRNGGDKPTWVKYSSTSGFDVYGSFELAGTQYFITKDDSGDYHIHDNAGSKVQDCEIQSHDVYLTLGEDFLRKVEIAYQGNGGSMSLVLTLDGSDIHTLTLSNTATPIVKEFELDRNEETRFSRLSWKLTGTFPSDFKLFGVWINRDSYGREALRGY